MDNEEKVEPTEAKPKKIGGLLSFFLFTIFASIVLTVITGINDVSAVLKIPELTKIWQNIIALLDIIYFAGFIGFMIYTIHSFSTLKSNAVSLGKMYLTLTLSINLIGLISSTFNGETMTTGDFLEVHKSAIRGLIYGTIWLLYLAISKRVHDTFPVEKREVKRNDKIFFSVILALYLIMFSLIQFGKTISNKPIPELIADMVSEAKIETKLPVQVDESTRMVDITAQPNAIQFHMALSNIDMSGITSDSLKSNMNPRICQNTYLKDTLNSGINIEYVYTVEKEPQQYLVSFSKADCPQ